MTQPGGRDQTAVVAAHVTQLGSGTIPPDVLRHAAVVLADTVGVLLAASRQPAVQAAAVAYPVDGTGPCTLVGRGRGTGPEHAALVNGIAGHDIELDDVHTSSRTHPACVVIPAALAAAELRPATTGADLLAAIIAGFDVEARASKAIGVQPAIQRGFHLSGVVGTLGATAAVGRVLALTAPQLASAFALAAAQSSGLLTFEEDPSHMLKSFNTGTAARAGVCAGRLAAAGFLGAPDVLAGRHNVVTSFGSPDHADFDQLTAGLGELFEITRTSLKRHACCGQMHAAVDALLDLRLEHGFGPTGSAGVDSVEDQSERLDQIEHIDVQVAFDALSMIDGNSLWTHNIQYVMALVASVGWVGREHFTDAWTSDPAITKLATRVTLRGSAALQAQFPGRQGAVVRVRTAGGGDWTATRTSAIGTPDQPMSGTDLRDKFVGLAGTVLPPAEVDALWRLLERFEELDDLTDFFRLLAGPA